jgi:type III secretion protein J
MRLRLTSLHVALLSAFLVTACTENLQHDLNEDDANDIYALLSENGISAKKLKHEGGNEPTYIISVPRQDYPQAVKLLREYALPRPNAGGFKRIGDSKGMIPTQTEERAMFLEAVQGEVQNGLNRVPGVLEARVIVNIPPREDLTQPENEPLPSSSVLVKYRLNAEGKAPLNETQVKAFVAAAVEKLRPENVTVIMTQAQPPSAEVNGEAFKDILGIRVAATSANEFKTMVGVAGLLILLMTAFTTWNFLKGGSQTPVRPRRVRPPEA